MTAPETFVFHPFKIVITGFNTDIEHNGVVYHVQTEDKGLDSPLILSLVYLGGTILASKRSRYEDLIEAGFNEGVLSERLKRQHRLICAAINAGRLEDLKRMGGKSPEEVPAASVVAAPEMGIDVFATTTPEEDVTEEVSSVEANAVESTLDTDSSEETMSPQDDWSSAKPTSAYTVHDPRRQSPQDKVVQAESGLALTVLDKEEFRAGEAFIIRILLEDRSRSKQKPVVGVTISVKILGTAFRPQMYSVKTESDGIAVVTLTMPSFTSGRAAVLIRALVKGEAIELRRVIHAAR